jgi:hypothetical protein
MRKKQWYNIKKCIFSILFSPVFFSEPVNPLVFFLARFKKPENRETLMIHMLMLR